jgi:hypothetical protein
VSSKVEIVENTQTEQRKYDFDSGLAILPGGAEPSREETLSFVHIPAVFGVDGVNGPAQLQNIV